MLFYLPFIHFKYSPVTSVLFLRNVLTCDICIIKSVCLTDSCFWFSAGQSGEIQVQQEQHGLHSCQVQHTHLCHRGGRYWVGSLTDGCHLALPALSSTDDCLRYAGSLHYLPDCSYTWPTKPVFGHRAVGDEFSIGTYCCPLVWNENNKIGDGGC